MTTHKQIIRKATRSDFSAVLQFWRKGHLEGVSKAYHKPIKALASAIASAMPREVELYSDKTLSSVFNADDLWRDLEQTLHDAREVKP